MHGHQLPGIDTISGRLINIRGVGRSLTLGGGGVGARRASVIFDNLKIYLYDSKYSGGPGDIALEALAILSHLWVKSCVFDTIFLANR